MATLYGPDGRVIRAQELTREVAVASLRDRWSTYPADGLTPQRLARIFKEADQGDIYRQAELFEEMEERDGHLFSELQTRKNAVLGLDWEVMPFSDDPQDKQVADFVAAAIDAVPGWEEVILDLLDAVGKGFSVVEIIWKIENGQALIDRLEWRPPKRFTWVNSLDLRIITDEHPEGEPLTPFKWIVHKYKARSGHPSRQGVLRVCAWMYLFKHYGVKDWVTFAEVYGMPLRLGKYEPGASQEDREALLRAVTQLGTDAAGIISKATEIEFVETKGGEGARIYPELADFCNREMSKAILGQTLTSEVGDRGSYAASRTHAEVRQDLLEADCKALAETLRRDLIRPLVLFNFGAEAAKRLPWIKYHYEPPEDLKQAADTYAVLVKDVGLPVSAEHLYERFGVPRPEPGQAIVAPSGAGAAPTPMRAPIGPPGLRLVANAAPPGSYQAQIDGLADQAAADAARLFGDLAEPILRLIREAESLEEIERRLVEVYQDMDTDRLADLVQRALYAADLFGRWTVIDGG